MPRNVEIKARAVDFERQRYKSEQLAEQPPLQLVQLDTFFRVTHGRLKLREFNDGTGELIAYRRDDRASAKTSHYTISPTNDPRSLKRALTDALGIRAEVRKQRTVYLCGQTRIHLDKVEQLGEFLELEVVLSTEQDEAEGSRIVNELMRHLDIQPEHLIAGAYIDLLEQQDSRKMENTE